MPIYSYRCSEGHSFEELEPFDAPRERRCTMQGCRRKADRVLALAHIRFKGKGFYSTDYGKHSRS